MHVSGKTFGGLLCGCLHDHVVTFIQGHGVPQMPVCLYEVTPLALCSSALSQCDYEVSLNRAGLSGTNASNNDKEVILLFSRNKLNHQWVHGAVFRPGLLSLLQQTQRFCQDCRTTLWLKMLLCRPAMISTSTISIFNNPIGFGMDRHKSFPKKFIRHKVQQHGVQLEDNHLTRFNRSHSYAGGICVRATIPVRLCLTCKSLHESSDACASVGD